MEKQSFKLDSDIAWNVFSINADMECETEDDFPAIHTLRHTSQVCSSWRDLIVSSPSLWARVINGDSLRAERWRKEVLNRTGCCSLSVRGETDQEGVISLLVENWPRIRHLTLNFVRSTPKKFKQDMDLWTLLVRPANVLESFQLSLRITVSDYWEPNGIFSPPDFTIFDNHAPLLKHFSAMGINSDIRADWALQLRHLALSTPIPVHELIEALSHLPFLETLEDRFSHAVVRGDPERSRCLPKIALPRLKNILISTKVDITPYMDFLAQVEPVYDRVLAFNSEPCQSRYIPDLQGIAAVSEILCIYSNQADLGASTKVTLRLFRSEFTIKALLPARREFRFSQECRSDFPADDTVNQLLSAFHPPTFHDVRILDLHVAAECGISLMDPNFINFIMSFPSLDILDTSPMTLDFLLGLPEGILKAVFPVMQEIQIYSPMDNEIASVRAFILSRSALGVPISILNVRKLGWRDLKNLGPLEECVGLTVTVISLNRKT
ncbi:hypothetical protein GALMADRAFT_251907 [Galerina marginata CBS 339.88]|uniref:F-box domain-containing protein n=1 Tax=Galerina marginata (strain CBS 339.88) TaxID=685588 RepID=A0A067SQS0_GALM3|nr:hypothetical protein GALMADRAFT_251907 [Galerina marginata CBS 339.88]